MIVFSVEEALQQAGFQSSPSSFAFTETPQFALNPPPPTDSPVEAEPALDWILPQAESEDPPPAKAPASLFEIRESAPLPPKVVATLPGFLLLSPEKSALSLVDQRAAHSRIIYEKLLDQDPSTNVSVQNLLIPYTFEMTPIEASTLSENLPFLNKLGINIQEFGNHSFIIHSLPEVWSDTNIQQLITDIANNLREYESDGFVKQDKEKRVALAASHAAVSQKKILTAEEGQSLVNTLMKCRVPHQCPLGKPTMVEMTHEDIAKQFQK